MTMRADTLPFMHKISKSFSIAIGFFRAFWKSLHSCSKKCVYYYYKCIYRKDYWIQSFYCIFSLSVEGKWGGAIISLTSIIGILHCFF